MADSGLFVGDQEAAVESLGRRGGEWGSWREKLCNFGLLLWCFFQIFWCSRICCQFLRLLGSGFCFSLWGWSQPFIFGVVFLLRFGWRVFVLRLDALEEFWWLKLSLKPVCGHIFVDGVESPELLFFEFFKPLPCFIVSDPERGRSD